MNTPAAADQSIHAVARSQRDVIELVHTAPDRLLDQGTRHKDCVRDGVACRRLPNGKPTEIELDDESKATGLPPASTSSRWMPGSKASKAEAPAGSSIWMCRACGVPERPRKRMRAPDSVRWVWTAVILSFSSSVTRQPSSERARAAQQPGDARTQDDSMSRWVTVVTSRSAGRGAAACRGPAAR
eukprot:CAMPEP_0115754676 /NCGR_PEP_ID=MMETSP0272-20121206/96993_1 /TAXON_ID=71861 /ORGANISM="Scrippsiella trochoidea, Strain CCMP3099" /LENGTH=184 /DNA_ID=CAMNT_0003200091 /DNA_START=1039 /DNA_END=1589 /DNA_ORIENTATION=+